MYADVAPRQAKEYRSCLTDLINLEFFPPALAEDKEALDIIVPTLANTLATLYEDRKRVYTACDPITTHILL